MRTSFFCLLRSCPAIAHIVSNKFAQPANTNLAEPRAKGPTKKMDIPFSKAQVTVLLAVGLKTL